MEGIVIKVVNKSVYIMGDFAPGTLLVSNSGAKLLVVSRRRELLPEYVEMLRLAEVLEDARSVSASRALLVGGEPPRPGEAVKPFEWPSSGRGIFSPEGKVDLLQYSVSPHLSIIGMTGAGKTTLVKILVEDAIKRGLNVVIFDVHGEYGDLAQKLGGYAGPPILPLCELTDQELLAITGLLRVQSPIRMMRYLRFFVKAFCAMADKNDIKDVQAALQKAAEAMMMLDAINPNVKTLDGRDSLLAEFANSLKETAGSVVYNALKEIVKKDEERVAAAMMYLLWAVSASRVALRGGDLPPLYVVNLFESKELFMTSDVTIGLMSYMIRYLVERRQKAVVVVEEAAKLMADETMSRVIYLALAQTRKFGLILLLVSQKPGEYVANTRIVAGRVRNSSWARELASIAPQMPTDVARLLPQLRRGEFIYVDDDVIPIRAVP
ncbi:MAG: ATP-binding protein [Pyrobaculum sp.]